jgi:hypothetical protein
MSFRNGIVVGRVPIWELGIKMIQKRGSELVDMFLTVSIWAMEEV